MSRPGAGRRGDRRRRPRSKPEPVRRARPAPRSSRPSCGPAGGRQAGHQASPQRAGRDPARQPRRRRPSPPSRVIAWPYVAIPAGLLVAWLVACRLMVKSERKRARAAARRRDAPVEDARPRRSSRPREAASRSTEVDEIDPMADTSAGIAAIVDPAMWDPVPVTLPTYVTKPAATRRTVRTIDLDSTGVWTSGRTDADAAARPRGRRGRQGRAQGPPRRRRPARGRLLTPTPPRTARGPWPSSWSTPALPGRRRARLRRRAAARRCRALLAAGTPRSPPIREVRDQQRRVGHRRPDPHHRARRRQHDARDAHRPSTGRRPSATGSTDSRPDAPLVASVDGLWTLRAGRHRRPDHLGLDGPAASTAAAALLMPAFGRMWQGYARQALEQIEGLLLSRDAPRRADSVTPRGRVLTFPTAPPDALGLWRSW